MYWGDRDHMIYINEHNDDSTDCFVLNVVEIDTLHKREQRAAQLVSQYWPDLLNVDPFTSTNKDREQK